MSSTTPCALRLAWQLSVCGSSSPSVGQGWHECMSRWTDTSQSSLLMYSLLKTKETLIVQPKKQFSQMTFLWQPCWRLLSQFRLYLTFSSLPWATRGKVVISLFFFLHMRRPGQSSSSSFLSFCVCYHSLSLSNVKSEHAIFCFRRHAPSPWRLTEFILTHDTGNPIVFISQWKVYHNKREAVRIYLLDGTHNDVQLLSIYIL